MEGGSRDPHQQQPSPSSTAQHAGSTATTRPSRSENDCILRFVADEGRATADGARFEIAEPPLKLELLHNPDKVGTIDHLVVEVPTGGQAYAAAAQLSEEDCSTISKSRTPVASPLRNGFGG